MTLPTLLSFLPAPSTVCALPSWENPRLLFSANSFSDRWRRSAFYPAFKKTGRLYRIALRSRVAFFPRSRKLDGSPSDWLFREFLKDSLPTAVNATVLVGTPGPAQKVTIQLRDNSGVILGYGKYAENDNARYRLQKEWEILREVPPGVAPRPIQFGGFGAGDLLVVEPLEGDPVRAVLPPDSSIENYVTGLQGPERFPVERHPWITQIRPTAPGIDSIIGPLTGRDWANAIRHGDFAPWNLRRRGEKIVAFDWEYGSLVGFPYLDLAFYFLQTAALVARLNPEKALDDAVDYLSRGPLISLGAAGCRSIVRLAALEAFLLARQDGHADESPLQTWRRPLLEGLL